MHEPTNTCGMAIDPHIITQHDKRAVELLKQARDAHDVLEFETLITEAIL